MGNVGDKRGVVAVKSTKSAIVECKDKVVVEPFTIARDNLATRDLGKGGTAKVVVAADSSCSHAKGMSITERKNESILMGRMRAVRYRASL